MAFYRKKPVVIEAVRLPLIDASLPEWLAMSGRTVIFKREEGIITEVLIKTLEGTMTARCGDWIIRGVQGEIYPCKPDIFAATYEAVEDVAKVGVT